jgi:hypothetical protein
MGLQDSIRSDARKVFLNENDFAERIVYHFRGGGSESVSALVNRNPPAIYDDASNIVLPSFEITIANSCVSGITSAKINVGGDEVDVVKEFGNPQLKRCAVLQVTEQDIEGTITFLVM